MEPLKPEYKAYDNLQGYLLDELTANAKQLASGPRNNLCIDEELVIADKISQVATALRTLKLCAYGSNDTKFEAGK